MSNKTNLAAVLKKFPQIYQPIYGHPEYDNEISRLYQNKIQDIRKVYDALSRKLNRPLRIFEIGCGFGFTSLTLASWGAEVTAIDGDRAFSELWKILRGENPALKITFDWVRIEDYPLNKLNAGTFDLVVSFGVFNTLCGLHGLSKVKLVIGYLAQKIPACIFEMALRTKSASYCRSIIA